MYLQAAGPLQTCASHGADVLLEKKLCLLEAAIYSMHQMFEMKETDGVLLIEKS